MSWRGLLASRYCATVALVVFALVPYLALSSALSPLEKVLSAGAHLSTQALQLTSGMANAAYALGTVISVQLASIIRSDGCSSPTPRCSCLARRWRPPRSHPACSSPAT